jgi:hypothetical protein
VRRDSYTSPEVGIVEIPHGPLAALTLANVRLTVEQQCRLKSTPKTNSPSPIRRKVAINFAVRNAQTTPARGHDAVFGASCLEGSNLFEDHAAPGREKAFSEPVARPLVNASIDLKELFHGPAVHHDDRESDSYV